MIHSNIFFSFLQHSFDHNKARNEGVILPKAGEDNVFFVQEIQNREANCSDVVHQF